MTHKVTFKLTLQWYPENGHRDKEETIHRFRVYTNTLKDDLDAIAEDALEQIKDHMLGGTGHTEWDRLYDLAEEGKIVYVADAFGETHENAPLWFIQSTRIERQKRNSPSRLVQID